MPKLDTRIARAKRVLENGIADARRAGETCTSRSTGTRTQYKGEAEAARRALAILSERKPR